MIELRILRTGEEKSHIHTDIEMLYVLEGQALINISDKTYTLNKNGILLVNSNNRHSFSMETSAVVCRLNLTYHDLLENLQKDYILFWCNSSGASSAGYGELVKILDDMIDAWVVTEKSMYIQKSLYYKLVGCLAEHFLITEDHKTSHGKSNFQKDAIIQYINAHYFRPLTLKEMADRMYMTESAFSKYFKRTAGINFVEYVNNIRIHYAVEDLLYTQKNITRVALDNGFSNPSLFNKVFKAMHHMTPTDFRNAMGGTQAPQAAASHDTKELARRFLENRQLHASQAIQEKYIYVHGNALRPYKNGWNRALNLGAAVDLMSARLQQQIATVQKDLQFEYGRIWNVFSWEMKLRENHLSQELKFDSIDNVLDFLTDHEITPMLDLGDKVNMAYRNCSDVVYQEEKKNVFNTVDEYSYVLTRFLEHVIRRYGRAAVNRWIFELWFDTGSMSEGLVTVNPGYDYTLVYEKTADILKRLVPEAKLGGAGLRPGNLHEPLKHFLGYISKMIYPPDFISIYSFPYCWIDENDIQGSTICSHTEFIEQDIECYHSIAMQYHLPDIPLYITEWNMSLSERNYYNDSCGKAALMLKNMTEHLESVSLAAYWSISDLWSDYYDSNRLLFGGGGLLNKEGVAKPAYYAMKFMSQMYPMHVDKGDGYWITSDGSGRYAVLCFNYKAIGLNYYLRPESDIRMDDLETIHTDCQQTVFHISISDITEGCYDIRKYRITPEYGSALNIWRQLGQEISIREDVEYMQKMCGPRIEVCHKRSLGSTLVLDEILEAHELRLIFISA